MCGVWLDMVSGICVGCMGEWYVSVWGVRYGLSGVRVNVCGCGMGR